MHIRPHPPRTLGGKSVIVLTLPLGTLPHSSSPPQSYHEVGLLVPTVPPHLDPSAPILNDPWVTPNACIRLSPEGNVLSEPVPFQKGSRAQQTEASWALTSLPALGPAWTGYSL